MHMRDMKAQDIVAYSTQKSVANELPLLTDLWDSDTLYALIDLYKDRTSTVVELLQEVRLLHAAPQSYNKEDSEKWLDVAARDHLRDLLKIIEALPVFSVELLTRTVKDTAKQMGIKLGHLAQPLRIALVGKAASPGVFALMSLVGKQESCARIARFLSQKVE